MSYGLADGVAVARGIGGSVNSYLGIAALRASGGCVVQASDDAILAAQGELGRQGLFAEPAAAASLAGLRALRALRRLEPGAIVVLISTSSGLKHLAPTVSRVAPPIELPEPTIAALADAAPAVRDAIAAAAGQPRSQG